jgi:hypothetical protein
MTVLPVDFPSRQSGMRASCAQTRKFEGLTTYSFRVRRFAPPRNDEF